MDITISLRSMARDRQLHFLSRAIGEITIACRAIYNEPDEISQLRTGIEIIHRLAGHLRDLCDPAEPMADSRLQGILEQLTLLPRHVAERITQSFDPLSEVGKTLETRNNS